jgi:ATP/maltotriose-dependent transcriptional regulator MalT
MSRNPIKGPAKKYSKPALTMIFQAYHKVMEPFITAGTDFLYTYAPKHRSRCLGTMGGHDFFC